jgi:hypothetical protein
MFLWLSIHSTTLMHRNAPEPIAHKGLSRERHARRASAEGRWMCDLWVRIEGAHVRRPGPSDRPPHPFLAYGQA